MMEATFSSETSPDFQRNARPYFPDDRTIHNHECENLKSYILTEGFRGFPKSLHENSGTLH
jgi:hypothetical protein